MKFVDVIGRWFNRYLANEEAIFLVVLLLVALLTITTLGGYLAPVLTGLVLAFVLEGLERRLEGYGLPRLVAFTLTFLIFLGGLIAFLLVVLPLAWRQFRALIDAVPTVLSRIQNAAFEMPEPLEDVLTREQVQTYLNQLLGEIGNFSASLVETLLAQVPSIVALLIYLVLVPISVFFFLKDRDDLMQFFATLLPRERPILSRVGSEMNQQLANYVRGKFIEIFIVGAVSYLTFEIMGLNYAALLGLLVGISVLVPYVGAALVTIPVALVAFSQWGWSGDFAWLMVAYAIIQALDGNVLVPLLFSEAVDLHPITIIVAVLAFGGVWGIWGVFFAIPLATLVKAIYNAWPREEDEPGALATEPERAAIAEV